MPPIKRTTGTRHSRSNFNEIHLNNGVNFKFEIIADANEDDVIPKKMH